MVATRKGLWCWNGSSEIKGVKVFHDVSTWTRSLQIFTELRKSPFWFYFIRFILIFWVQRGVVILIINISILKWHFFRQLFRTQWFQCFIFAVLDFNSNNEGGRLAMLHCTPSSMSIFFLVKTWEPMTKWQQMAVNHQDWLRMIY